MLDHLRGSPDRSSTIEELTVSLVERSPDPPDAGPSHKEVAASLEHTHLPKLADSRLVEYDPRSGDVRYRPEPELESFLDRILEFEE